VTRLQLSSIDRLPRAIPVWDAIISDLGNPPPERIAKALHVGRSTAYRWQAAGGGPRIACLALFWLTRWGRSEVDSQAVNDATMAVQLAGALKAERDELRMALADAERANRSLAYQLSRAEASEPFAVAVAPGLAAATPAGLALSPAHPQHGALEGVGLTFPVIDGGGALGGLDDCGTRHPFGATSFGVAGRPSAAGAGLGFSGSGRHQVIDGLAAAVEVVPEGDRQQRVQGDAEAVSVGAGLFVQPFGQPNVDSHGSPASDLRCKDGTIFAPSEDFPPVLQAGGAAGLSASCDAEGYAPGRHHAIDACAASAAAGAARPHPAATLAAPAQNATAGFPGRAATRIGTPPQEPAAGSARSAPPAVQFDKRQAPPASLPRPERPASLGHGPDPAPRAPPGAGAFAALVNAAPLTRLSPRKP